MVRLVVLAALLLSGCKTFGNNLTLVSSDPPGATVNVEGFGECEAPCTIELDAPRAVTIAKAGYDAQRIILEPGKKKIEVVLKLSAPTTEVDEEALPEVE